MRLLIFKYQQTISRHTKKKRIRTTNTIASRPRAFPEFSMIAFPFARSKF